MGPGAAAQYAGRWAFSANALVNYDCRKKPEFYSFPPKKIQSTTKRAKRIIGNFWNLIFQILIPEGIFLKYRFFSHLKTRVRTSSSPPNLSSRTLSNLRPAPRGGRSTPAGSPSGFCLRADITENNPLPPSRLSKKPGPPRPVGRHARARRHRLLGPRRP